MLRKRYVYVSLVSILAAAGYLALWKAPSNDLEFRELASPEGFRELVLESRASSLSPLSGLVRGTSTRVAVSDICNALFQDASSPKVGDESSKLFIVEFFDYRCPYCRKLTKILSQLHAERGVGIIYKEWPILGDSSVLAARAALAADRQGKYIAFHTRLMSSGFLPTPSYVDTLAVELGVDRAQLSEDMNAPDIANEIQRTADLAARFGFRGTPGLVVGRTVVHGAITRTQLERLIEDEVSSREPVAC